MPTRLRHSRKCRRKVGSRVVDSARKRASNDTRAWWAASRSSSRESLALALPTSQVVMPSHLPTPFTLNGRSRFLP